MLHWTELLVILIPLEIVSISTVKTCIKTSLPIKEMEATPLACWLPLLFACKAKGASTSVCFGYLFKYLSQQSLNLK